MEKKEIKPNKENPASPVLATAQTEKKKKEIPEALKKNLFKKGQSGNPNGRPKGVPLMSTILKKMLQEIVKDKTGKPMEINGIKMSYQQAVTLGLLNSGVKGNVLAIQEIFNRVDGKQGAGLNLGEDNEIDEIKITFNAPKKKK